MEYLILRTQKVKTMGELAAMAAHHSRTRATQNADPEGEVKFLVGSGSPYTDVKTILQSKKLKKRKNGVLAIEVLLSASPEFFRPGDPGRSGYYHEDRVSDFKEASLKWLRSHFGEQNLVSAVLHLDEATPHIQAVVVPIDENPRKRGPKRRLNARRWLGGKALMSAMQTEAANAFKHLGLQRGIKGSEAKHTTLREYYGEISREETFCLPEIPTPPSLLSKKAKTEWACKVSYEVHRDLSKQLNDTFSDASKARIADRKRREAVATAQAKSLENNLLADQLRDIPFDQIFHKYGWLPKPSDKSKWSDANGAVISSTPPLWHHWVTGDGGRGAIDLVMHLEEIQSGARPGFKQVLAILAELFGDEAASRSLAANAQAVTKEVLTRAQAFDCPKPVEELWPQVLKYLVEERRLDRVQVEHFHKEGLIYADSHRNAVFWNGSHVAELRGTRENSWRGLALGSKRLVEGGFGFKASEGAVERLVLVESAIDAISYYQLNGSGPYVVKSTAGVVVDAPYIKEFKQKGYEVVCAYDADQAGERTYSKMPSETMRERPPLGSKDWNDALEYTNREELPSNHLESEKGMR